VKPLRAAFAAIVVSTALALTASAPDPVSEATPSRPANAANAPDGVAIGAAAVVPRPGYTPRDRVILDTHEVPGSSTIVTSADPSIAIYDSPTGSIVQTINAADVLSVPGETPLVFLVKSVQADWYEVYLPIRPNGATGWVRGSVVTARGTTYSIQVDTAAHVLTLIDGAAPIEQFPIAVGRSDRPTPGGVYFIRELLIQPDATGLYGPYAYGLSGYSPVLEHFAGGDAAIGLHGTNDPARLGQDVSSGCIRMSNDAITRLVTVYGLPLGTPVYIS
jgi:lipoprotein-anchoring transpeptidase ErfK/SrfK